jgi:hypothetical protein
MHSNQAHVNKPLVAFIPRADIEARFPHRVKEESRAAGKLLTTVNVIGLDHGTFASAVRLHQLLPRRNVSSLWEDDRNEHWGAALAALLPTKLATNTFASAAGADKIVN